MGSFFSVFKSTAEPITDATTTTPPVVPPSTLPPLGNTRRSRMNGEKRATDVKAIEEKRATEIKAIEAKATEVKKTLTILKSPPPPTSTFKIVPPEEPEFITQKYEMDPLVVNTFIRSPEIEAFAHLYLNKSKEEIQRKTVFFLSKDIQQAGYILPGTKIKNPKWVEQQQQQQQQQQKEKEKEKVDNVEEFIETLGLSSSSTVTANELVFPEEFLKDFSIKDVSTKPPPPPEPQEEKTKKPIPSDFDQKRRQMTLCPSPPPPQQQQQQPQFESQQPFGLFVQEVRKSRTPRQWKRKEKEEQQPPKRSNKRRRDENEDEHEQEQEQHHHQRNNHKSVSRARAGWRDTIYHLQVQLKAEERLSCAEQTLPDVWSENEKSEWKDMRVRQSKRGGHIIDCASNALKKLSHEIHKRKQFIEEYTEITDECFIEKQQTRLDSLLQHEKSLIELLQKYDR